MLKQAKKHFRLEFCCRCQGNKGGLFRELIISCDPEHRPYIRARRRKNGIEYAGNYADYRDGWYHKQYDTKSWKSRCRKRHQWEKHFHTAYEIENANLLNKEHAAEKIYRIVQEHSGWIKIDIRDNPEWRDGIAWLGEKKKIECREDWKYPWSYPVRNIRALQQPTSSEDDFLDTFNQKKYSQMARGWHCFPRQSPEWKEVDAFLDVKTTKEYRSSDLRLHHTGKQKNSSRMIVIDFYVDLLQHIEKFNRKPKRKMIYAWAYHPHRPTRRRSHYRQKNTSLSNEPLKATPLLDFHTSLPRSIRRNWRYQQWENVMEFADAKVEKNYLALLNAALRLKLKIMYTPHAPENNPYAQLLWNLSKITALRDPASVALGKYHNADTQFAAWVNQCFFDYPLPDWAYRVMQTKTEEADRKALISWGCGQSSRSIFGLSKQENGIFHEIHFAVPSVRFALAYSAAMTRHCTRQLALAFAEALHGRDNAIYPYYLQRVRSLAEWFAVQKIDDLSQVGNLMDYFYRENYFLHDFDLKGRTLKSMLREMTLWHRELNLQEQGTGAWKTHNLSHVLEKDEVIFEELDNAKKLQYEGRRQHNCAASYLKKCMESRCAIVAMNELNSGLRVTLEINISDKKIVQAKGKCNAKPTSQDLKYIRRYARDKQLAIACAA